MESNNIKTIRLTSLKSQRSTKQVDLFDISGHFTPKGACIHAHEFNHYDSPKHLHMMHSSRNKKEYKPLVDSLVGIEPQQVMETKSHLRYD